MKNKKDIAQLLLTVSKKDIANLLTKDYYSFFESEFSLKYVQVLDIQNKKSFIQSRQQPEFEEEVENNAIEIWEVHSQFINDLKNIIYEQVLRQIISFYQNRPFDEVLTVLGQRFTSASERTAKALPPAEGLLKEALLKPHNSEIKMAVRAWEKHVGRSSSEFWGQIKGTPIQRERYALQLIESIFKTMTWWNTFTHYKHGVIYEIREPGGHGIRWKLEPLAFIGFVEPF